MKAASLSVSKSNSDAISSSLSESDSVPLARARDMARDMIRDISMAVIVVALEPFRAKGGLGWGLDPGQSWASYKALIQMHCDLGRRIECRPNHSEQSPSYFLSSLFEALLNLETKHISCLEVDATLLVVRRRTRDAALLHKKASNREKITFVAQVSYRIFWS